MALHQLIENWEAVVLKEDVPVGRLLVLEVVAEASRALVHHAALSTGLVERTQFCLDLLLELARDEV